MKTIRSFIKGKLKTTSDLVPLSSWTNSGKAIISVHCFVYNQEKYISRCLDSLLAQLVNFNVEILVHDDCSKDNSKTIIESYCKKYPNVIKPIFESENIYSKTGNFLEIARDLCERSVGKYIAICEGDDYWTDSLKLFLQMSVLENYKNCSFCVHRVNVESANQKFIVKDNCIPSFKMPTRFLNDKHFVSLIHDGYNFQTSSYFFSKSDYVLLFKNNPRYMSLMPTDDEVLIRHFGSLGETCFIDRIMSTYLQFTDGSWSKDHKENKNIKRRQRYLQAVSEFDHFTNYRYTKSCKKMILKAEVFSLIETKQYKSIFSNKELRRMLRKIDFKTYLSLKIRLLFRKEK